MPAKGLGLRARITAIPAAALVSVAPDPLVSVVTQWLFFGGPPAPVEIPYTWLSFPARWRHETMVNTATVEQFNGVEATKTNPTSVTNFGQRAGGDTLHTACDADPANLATWLVTYWGEQRMKQPALMLVDLAQRTDAEVTAILRVRQGTRVVVTDAPATWPEGSHSLVVEGVDHSGRADRSGVIWRTSPVPGSTTPGEPGPWLRYGSSMWNSADVIPA